MSLLHHELGDEVTTWRYHQRPGTQVLGAGAGPLCRRSGSSGALPRAQWPSGQGWCGIDPSAAALAGGLARH